MKPNSISTDRRLFLKTSLASALAAPLISQAQATAPGMYHEVAHELPINTDADVIVCGEGQAGVTAAISAARAGAKVRLFEVHGALGGVLSRMKFLLLGFNLVFLFAPALSGAEFDHLSPHQRVILDS